MLQCVPAGKGGDNSLLLHVPSCVISVPEEHGDAVITTVRVNQADVSHSVF